MRYLLVVVAVVAVVGCKKDKGGADKGADPTTDKGGGGGSYLDNAKMTEAKLMLNRLEKDLKTYAIQTGGVPVAKAPLTPASPCCAAPDHKCPVDPNNWAGEPWKSLEFTIDEPHLFQYDYESDGKTFTAHAVGDLGCNGKTTTLTLTGSIDANGVPTATIN